MLSTMTTIDDGRGFRKLSLNYLIDADPKKAALKIIVAYRAAGASMAGAAKLLGCSERTLYRWAHDRLHMQKALARIQGKIVP